MPTLGEMQSDAKGPFKVEMAPDTASKDGTEVYILRVKGRDDSSKEVEYTVERRYTCFGKFSASFRERHADLPAMPSKSMFKNIVPGFMANRRKSLCAIIETAVNLDPMANDFALRTFLALKGSDGSFAPFAAAPAEEDEQADDSGSMKAFVSDAKGGVSAKRIEKPGHPTGYDILVKNAACSMNPADFKAGSNVMGLHPAGSVLGFDSVGFVEATGHLATMFKTGDRVWFSGSLLRPGSNAEYTLVDERIVSLAPAVLSDAEAAAVPLVGITAFEGLTEKLDLSTPASIGKSILVLPGGGGVGSICIQLAKKMLNMVVIGTASRPETTEYCKTLGADYVIDHTKPLAPQIAAIGFTGVDCIFNAYDTSANFKQFCDIINPLGSIVSIVETNGAALDIGDLMLKRATFSWEFVFQRFMNGAEEDRIRQHQILSKLCYMYEAGTLQPIKVKELKMDEAGLKEARALQQSSKAIGKTALVW